YTKTTDNFGGESETWTNQVFTVVAGQPRMTSATTEAFTKSVDGTDAVTDPYTIHYAFFGQELGATPTQQAVQAWLDQNGGHRIIGQMRPAALVAKIHTATTDPLTQSRVDSYSSQVFDVQGGQPRLIAVTNESRSEAPDGAVTLTYPYTIRNTYNED